MTSSYVSRETVSPSILAFVEGGENGADAAKLAYMYQLMSYEHATQEAVMRNEKLSVFEQRTEETADLSLRENNVNTVADVFREAAQEGGRVNEKSDVGVDDILHLVKTACYRVFLQQLETLGHSPNANVRTNLEKVTDAVAQAVPFRKSSGQPDDDARYAFVTDVDAFVRTVRERVYNAFAFDKVSSVTFNAAVRDALFAMLKPWLVCRHLASFLPGYERPQLGAASYLDMQYARLALYRVAFDTLAHVRSYKMDAEDGNDDSVLADLAQKIANTLGTEYVGRHAREMPAIQEQVAAKSQATKEKSLQLYQTNARLEQRRANLVAMLHNQRALEREARMATIEFWIVVAVFIVLFGGMLSMLATRRFMLLYYVAGAVLVALVLWYVIALVWSTLWPRSTGGANKAGSGGFVVTA